MTADPVRVLKRAEVPVSDTWDLTTLFETDATWEAAFVVWSGEVDRFALYRGRLGESPAVLLEFLRFETDFERQGDRLGTFAFLKETEDLANSAYQGMKARYLGIAARAGVSVGSLYQYFADREALMTELVRRHVAMMHEVLTGALAGLSTRPPDEAVAQLVAAIVAAHRVAPRLHQALHQSLTHGKVDAIDHFESGLETLVWHALREYAALDLADPQLTASVLVRALGGLIRTTLRREPGRLDDPAFAGAMTGMILGTLERARRQAGV